MAKMGRPINPGSKMRLIDAAALVLSEEDREMDAFSMLREIYRRGLWSPHSPDSHSVDCALRGEICKEIEFSHQPRFRRTRRGFYEFREALFAPLNTYLKEK